MGEYDCVIVVLTYKNVEDIVDFFHQIFIPKSKIIVVNSFYDAKTLEQIEKIAKKNNADFLNVENRGYGYGNNIGIQYAREHYLFKYLIISNPDIIIKKFDMNFVGSDLSYIYAPRIITLRGKNQNPYYYSYCYIIEYLKYLGNKKNSRFLFYLPIIINKMYRIIRSAIGDILKIKKEKIYAAHGSFLIIGREALEALVPIYNEKMFLTSEEEHLAKLAKKRRIKTYYIRSVIILHKEDGSMKMADFDTRAAVRASRSEYYRYWYNWK